MRINTTPSRERLEELFSIDSEGYLVNKIDRSSNSKAGQRVGCLNDGGYLLVRVDGVNYRSHRLIWKMAYDEEPPRVVDHIDGNPSNNRVENLRGVSVGHNIRRSKKKQRGNVGRQKSGNYSAQCWIDNKVHYVGTYRTELLAREAIDKYLDEKGARYD